jgi:uncharacterized membrane protein
MLPPVRTPLLLGSAIASLLLLASASSADVVKLKNGEELAGVVVKREGGVVTLRVAGGEIGFPESLVESVDTSKGPTAEQLTKQEDASREALAAANRERAVVREARRSAARAVEAAATVETAPAPVEDEEARAARLETEMRAKLDAIDSITSQIVSQRERARVRRALLNEYFGGSGYDPVLDITR